MKWDLPIRPIQSGPLTDQEIKELNAFLLAEDGLENPMDFFTFDGFICALLSGPDTIMPSEWMRWVWDQEEGEQPPEFTSEKQGKRILSLLIGHANILAFTPTHGPQHYEPLFYAHKIEGRSVPIVHTSRRRSGNVAACRARADAGLPEPHVAAVLQKGPALTSIIMKNNLLWGALLEDHL